MKYKILAQTIAFYILTLFVIFISSFVFLKLNFLASIFVIFSVIFSISYFIPFLTQIFLRTKIYNGKYRNLIDKFILKNRVEIKNIYIKRSKSSNAFACSFFKNKSIVFFSHTLEEHPWDEIKAVTAHEIGHHVNNDPLLLTFIVAFTTTLCGLINFKIHSLVYLPILESIIIYPIFLSIQRWREHLADKYAYEVLENPKYSADFFRKIVVFSKKEGIKINKNPNFLSKIFFSHPPMYERIAFFENKK